MMKNGTCDADLFRQWLQIRLSRPYLFGPPVSLEFSLCALLDSWALLGQEETKKALWRSQWQTERKALHGADNHHFLSDPIGYPATLFMTYATPATLNQSYNQVMEGVRQSYLACRDHYREKEEVFLKPLGALIEEALARASCFGQPAGLEGYCGTLLGLFEAHVRPDRTPTVSAKQWQAYLETMNVDVPLESRHLRDVLSVHERSRREKAIPPKIYEQSQKQVVSGFQRIIELCQSASSVRTVRSP